MSKTSLVALEHVWYMLCVAQGLPHPQEEFRFAPPRRWRFDWAWPDRKVAVEIDGATWVGGRHTRGAGYERDCEKFNTAALLGWRVLRFTRGMLESGEAFNMTLRALGGVEVTV